MSPLDNLYTLLKSFSGIPRLPNFCSCGFVVDGTVDGKDNKEEKTREVSDIGCITKVKIFIN